MIESGAQVTVDASLCAAHGKGPAEEGTRPLRRPDEAHLKRMPQPCSWHWNGRSCV